MKTMRSIGMMVAALLSEGPFLSRVIGGWGWGSPPYGSSKKGRTRHRKVNRLRVSRLRRRKNRT